jgi:hypothetical protein
LSKRGRLWRSFAALSDAIFPRALSIRAFLWRILHEWTRLDAWWDRKGENKIDLLAENEIDGTYAVCEVKREKARINLDAVKAKYEAFVKSSGKWKRAKPKFIALSMDDM